METRVMGLYSGGLIRGSLRYVIFLKHFNTTIYKRL